MTRALPGAERARRPRSARCVSCRRRAARSHTAQNDWRARPIRTAATQIIELWAEDPDVAPGLERARTEPCRHRAGRQRQAVQRGRSRRAERPPVRKPGEAIRTIVGTVPFAGIFYH